MRCVSTFVSHNARNMRSKEFSCSIPDVSFSSSGKANVVMKIDGTTVYDEWLYPVGGTVTLTDLSDLVTPYAREYQTVTLSITATSEGGSSLLSTSAQIIYCQADFCDEPAETFLQQHFLSILMGTKLTAMGFRMAPVEHVHGDKEWVYGIKSGGRNVYAGERVSIDVPLVLQVGNGKTEEEDESLNDVTIDSYDILDDVLE